jgi:hypothetical protein
VSANRRKPENQQLISQLGGHARWGKCENDRAEETATPRAAFEKTFVVQAGGDPAVPFEQQPKHVQQRATSLRKAYFTRLALKSVQARARRAAGSADA